MKPHINESNATELGARGNAALRANMDARNIENWLRGDKEARRIARLVKKSKRPLACWLAREMPHLAAFLAEQIIEAKVKPDDIFTVPEIARQTLMKCQSVNATDKKWTVWGEPAHHSENFSGMNGDGNGAIQFFNRFQFYLVIAIAECAHEIKERVK